MRRGSSLPVMDHWVDITIPAWFPRLAVLLLMAGSGASAPAAGQPTRSSDGLLHDKGLQFIVHLGLQRDVPALMAYLGHPDPRYRARAAFALASVQDPRALPLLLARLDDPSAAARADAAFALGQTAGAIPEGALSARLRSETDRAAAEELIDAIGKTGAKPALLSLIHTVPDSLNPEAALAIARFGLRGIHAPEAVAFLLDLLKGESEEERTAAAYYFGRARDIDAWRIHAGELRSFIRRSPVNEPALLYLLPALARSNEAEDTAWIVRMLLEPDDWRVRVAAARVMTERTGQDAAGQALLRALGDPSIHVAVAAAEALGSGFRFDAARLRELTAWIDDRATTWQIAARLLVVPARQDDATTVLPRLTRFSDNPYALALALPALSHLSGQAAEDTLMYHIRNDIPISASAAVEALANRWKQVRNTTDRTDVYYAAFLSALQSRDLAVTTAAAPILSDSIFVAMGSAEELESVYRQLQPPVDLESMVAVLESLGRIGGPGIDSLFVSVLSSDQEVLRATVAKYLGEPDVPTHAPPSTPFDRAVDWDYLRKYGERPALSFETEKGDILLECLVEQAPLTCETLLRFIGSGRYDGVPFHRVVPGFVMQGGDFERGDGFGGPGYAIRSEFTRQKFGAYIAGMASAGKDTEGSQWFVTHSMQPHLDGRYTAFGRVTAGQQTVDSILEGDRILRARVIAR